MQLVDLVYQSVRDGIFSSLYLPGTFIVEQEIAQKYNVSKGTAREALHRLCMEGHLKTFPRKGYLVTLLTRDEIRQIQRLRMPIELLVFSILIDQTGDEQLNVFFPLLDSSPEQGSEYDTINARFHLELAKLTGDPFIINTLRTLLGALTVTAYYQQVGNTFDGQECHQGILKALLMRDHTVAADWLRKDLFR